MALEIVPVYAALLGLLFFFLSFRAMLARRTAQKPIGTLGDESLDRRVRVHANFAEYVPFALLLLVFAELRGLPAAFLHLSCVALLVGRCAHAWGVSRTAEVYAWRRLGLAGTLASIGMTVAALLASYL